MDFSTVKDIVIPEGIGFVDKITDASGNVIWEKKITDNGHEIKFVTLDGLIVTGVWNEAKDRLEC